MKNNLWLINLNYYNSKSSAWKRKFNWELKEKIRMIKMSNFIRRQRIHWANRVMRRNEEVNRLE